jgi:hypothetical protein
MGRTPEQVAADRAAAKQFFLERFGLDFTKTEPDEQGIERIPGALFQGFMFSPKANYRAYTISEESVAPEGWVVRDGGWRIELEQDMLLFGKYRGNEGKLVPAGTSFVFGNYNILAERLKSNEEIVIHYESGGPIFANADGVTSFICDLSHPKWGKGKARGGVSSPLVIRNVLTFPSELP